MSQLTWAVNDWDKQDNQWGGAGLVYMVESKAPLRDQLSHAEGAADNFASLAGKHRGRRDGAKYSYKARVARDHVASIKKKMQQAAAPPAKKPAAMDDDKLKTAAFGTDRQQAAADRTDLQKEAFDRGLAAYGTAGDTRDLVKALKGPVQKGGGLVEARDTAGFGELQQIVKFALAKTPREAYEVALARREIYLRVNVINKAAARILHAGGHFPASLARRTALPELGPFAMRDIDPRNRQGTFALLGGASDGGILRSVAAGGRFVRAGLSFCAETPDRKAHLDFSVGFDWEPGVAFSIGGKSGVSVCEGKQPQRAFEMAKGPEATVTSGGLRVFVAISNQVVVIGVGRA